MKTATIVHNPKAGGGEFSKKKLIKLIESAGLDCSYSSTKEKGWEAADIEGADVIVLAGGDGTVRKIAMELFDKKTLIGLIPLGTANNIATTLGIRGDASTIIQHWNPKHTRKYDVGRIYDLKAANFFLEGLGYGVFPRLMKEMKKHDTDSSTPEENLKLALETIHDIILNCKAKFCKINIDGADYSGNFILAEVMNTQSIGPNLNLAPFADPSDGSFDVILISERQREEFANYVFDKMHGKEASPVFNILKAKNLDIFWEGRLLHVDDEIVSLKEPQEIRIKLQEGVLEFLIPDFPKEAQEQDTDRL